MKKTFRIFGMALIAVLLATVSTACGKDDDEPKSDAQSIVGTWVAYPEQGGTFTLTLNSNHTGSISYTYSIISRATISGSKEEFFSWTVSESSSSVKYLDIIHSSGDYLFTEDGNPSGSYTYILAGQQLSLGGLTFSRR